jgi:hypothetical protein
MYKTKRSTIAQISQSLKLKTMAAQQLPGTETELPRTETGHQEN